MGQRTTNNKIDLKDLNSTTKEEVLQIDQDVTIADKKDILLENALVLLIIFYFLFKIKFKI